jgi:hypothetical protein
MSIEKKSLISTLKTTKKANVASTPASHDGITKSETTRKAQVLHRKAKMDVFRKAQVK